MADNTAVAIVQARRALMGALTSATPTSRSRALAMVEQLFSAVYAQGWEAGHSNARPTPCRCPEVTADGA